MYVFLCEQQNVLKIIFRFAIPQDPEYYLTRIGTIPIRLPHIRLHTPTPLCMGAAYARPHRRGGVFRRLLMQTNRNSKRKRHRVPFFPLALRVYC